MLITSDMPLNIERSAIYVYAEYAYGGGILSVPACVAIMTLWQPIFVAFVIDVLYQ